MATGDAILDGVGFDTEGGDWRASLCSLGLSGLNRGGREV